MSDFDTPVVSDGALDLLLKRLGDAPDFPAFSTAVQQLNRLSNSEGESLASMAEVVLQDAGLTQKMLRAVNSAHYRRSNAMPVTTMSRAIQLLGFDSVRNLALSLLHLERLQGARNAEVLLRQFIEVCVAGEFAREIAGHLPVPAEQAGLCAAFQDLGWMVVLHNFPDEAAAIERERRGAAQSLAAAARAVLGVDLGELGLRLATQWGFADAVLEGMMPLAPDQRVRAPTDHRQWLRTGASASREAAQMLLSAVGRTPEQALPPLIARYGRALNLQLAPMCAAARRAIERVNRLCAALDVTLDQMLARQLAELAEPPVDPSRLEFVLAKVVGDETVDDAVLQTTALAAAAADDPNAQVAAGRRNALSQPNHSIVTAGGEHIARGLADLQTALERGAHIGELIRIAMQTMHQSLALQRVILAMRDARTQRLVGRIGVGERATDLAGSIEVDTRRAVDVFAAACLKGTDLLISDASAPSLQTRLPSWLRSAGFDAGSFLLLPMRGPHGPIGLLYGDHARVDGIRLQPSDLDLLRTLRNRLVEAIRERG